MNRGLESGFVKGSSKGVYNGLNSGMQGAFMADRWNMLNPSAITEPKCKPVFYINADNVALVSGNVSIAYNLSERLPNDILTQVENVLIQNTTSYRPPLVLNGLGGKNYMNFSDTSARTLTSAISLPLYASTSPSVSGTGLTYMFIIKRLPGSTRTILDGRDSTFGSTVNDLLIEVNNAGRITFDYKGGIPGSVTSCTGTAGVNLLNDWSILTVKTQLRIDGGAIPSDSSGTTVAKRYCNPTGARRGSGSAIDIFVNGIEQSKTYTTNNFTNADNYSDGTYRMLNRDIFIGNQAGSTTAGTHIAAALLIPAYIEKALQTRLENYFRYYYNRPF